MNTSTLFTLIYICLSKFLKKVFCFAIRSACHLIFIFVMNNIIHLCKATLDYILLIKSDI